MKRKIYKMGKKMFLINDDTKILKISDGCDTMYFADGFSIKLTHFILHKGKKYKFGFNAPWNVLIYRRGIMP